MRGDRLITEKEVSQVLHISVSTLKRWRHRNPPVIPFTRLGDETNGPIRYQVSIVEMYVNRHRKV